MEVPELSFLLWAPACEAAGTVLITRDFKGCSMLGNCLPWFSVATDFRALQITASYSVSSASK